MKTALDKLTVIDYQILEYISQFDKVLENELEQHFSDIPIHYHLRTLSTIEYRTVGSANFHIPISDSSYIHKIVKPIYDEHDVHFKDDIYYSISNLGKSTLLEYQRSRQEEKKELWLKNVWIPIIVSFVTTNVTVYIIPKLPLILRWLCDTLSKIFSP